jgi:hypothetical protein
MKYLAPLLLAAVASAPASACEYCLIGQGISPLETQSGAGMRVAQRYSLLDSVYEGTHKRENPGVTEQYWTTELSGFYSVNDKLTVLVTLPVRETWGDGELATTPSGDPDREDISGGATGIGDLSLLGRYTLMSRHTLDASTIVAGVLGIKLPTGNTDRYGDTGEFLDAHLQLGTGSTDLLVGVSMNHAVGRYAVSANLLASIAGKGEAGDMKHQFGDSINYDVTARYRLSPEVSGESANALHVSLGINGEYRGKEKLDGATVSDSGGHTIYLTPGLQYQMAAHWVFEGTYQHAVYHDLNELQLGENYKLFGAVTYLF